ncbi:MAG: RluA family pseudouridine synthase [Anaerolineales bacterium]|nr:RluA family pseudouridine synthase [Anaerolineales bacterium]
MSEFTIPIIYQDEQILVLNKPANLPVLPDGWDPTAPYLVKLLEAQFPKVWTVHRIDKITSGIIVFALTAEAHRALNIQFEKHQVEKKYHALINGAPGWNEKVTKFPLRVNVGHKHRTMVDNKNGVRSETRIKILKRNPTAALIEAEPRTGRTHQIRVHLYALGHPLLGDILYSAPETNLIARPALHAHTLSFIHPTRNATLTLTAPYPEDFASALKQCKFEG